MQNTNLLADRPLFEFENLRIGNAVAHEPNYKAPWKIPEVRALEMSVRRRFTVRYDFKYGPAIAYATGRQNAEFLLDIAREYHPHERIRVSWIRNMHDNPATTGRHPHAIRIFRMEEKNDKSPIAICENCRAMEHHLNIKYWGPVSRFTTDCSYELVQGSQQTLVLEGCIDFVDGRWVKGPNPIRPSVSIPWPHLRKEKA
jgi:hypothetical protein